MNEPLEKRVILVKDNEVNFPFDDSKPSFSLRGGEVKWGAHVSVDLFPCYSHDRELVLKEASRLESRFPLRIKPYYFILPYEDVGRTNGCCQTHYIYNEGSERGQIDFIILSGKRIPPMPSMTRYLCAHEYSHAVNNSIERYRKYEDGSDKFDRLYAEMRNIDFNSGYGGRKWHTSIGEIIANDCRICVFDTEREFWPHDVPHPDTMPQVHIFWYNLMLEYGYNFE